jgi:hypothetical protein
VNIRVTDVLGFIEFDHAMFSVDKKNAAHLHVKGYAKIGEVFTAYLASEQ